MVFSLLIALALGYYISTSLYEIKMTLSLIGLFLFTFVAANLLTVIALTLLTLIFIELVRIRKKVDCICGQNDLSNFFLSEISKDVSQLNRPHRRWLKKL